ncbi:MAG: histidinol phosphate phosphatase [Betaproteobacteria bacterium AqS2]|uniref:Histidinol phosphate phosphatase n=1 Tax=Candidatus Amphirhobacter heronislandensis TaxID=1732024 RepID=A0A930UC98_9GAMM|nr:histidinol phosphate phosphatase [Betaproteobacteria bacterium AqS2]
MTATVTDFDIAIRLGEVAREILIPRATAADFGVRTKDDGSPVTDADLACERAMRGLLAELVPSDAVWGEELGQETGARCWVLDPIDGTKAFASGSPLFCSLAGLVADGSFAAGVIEVPMLRQRWAAGGGQGVVAGPDGERPLAGLASAKEKLAEASVAVTAPLRHPRGAELCAQAAFTRYGGDAYNFACVASGRLDIALDEGLQPHDFTALLPVLAHAGACCSDFSGRPPVPGQPSDLIAAGSASLLEQALKILAG